MRARADRYRRITSRAVLRSRARLRGMELFYSERGECFHCHATRLFTDNAFHDIGLDADVAGTGRGAVTGRTLDDDRFATLEEVVEFYSDGVIYTDTLDTLITVGGFALTVDERADLVALPRSLTDDALLTDPDLAAP